MPCCMVGGLVRQILLHGAAQSNSHPGMLALGNVMAPAQRPNHPLQMGEAHLVSMHAHIAPDLIHCVLSRQHGCEMS